MPTGSLFLTFSTLLSGARWGNRTLNTRRYADDQISSATPPVIKIILFVIIVQGIEKSKAVEMMIQKLFQFLFYLCNVYFVVYFVFLEVFYIVCQQTLTRDAGTDTRTPSLDAADQLPKRGVHHLIIPGSYFQTTIPVPASH